MERPLKSFDLKMYEYEFDRTNIPESFEERLNLLRKVGKDAQKQFEIDYKNLLKWFDEHDQLNVLSFVSYYFFTSKVGDDEEARTGTIEFPPHLQEILQALSLTKERNYEPKPFIENAPFNLKKLINEIKNLLELKFFDIPEEVKTEKDLEMHKLRVDFMVDTMAVRGWCYKHQLEKMLIDLCKGIDKEFFKIFGFHPHFIFEIISKLIQNVNLKLRQHQENIKQFVNQKDYDSVFSTYEKVFPNVTKSTKEGREKLFQFFRRDLKQLKAVLISHSDLFLYKIFTFSIEDIDEYLEGKLDKNHIAFIMDRLSLTFGDLENENIEHFILNNPVQKKPFIKIDGLEENDKQLYYCSILGTVEYLQLEILESFIKDYPSINQKFSKVKAKYLEKSVKNLFDNNFSDAIIFQNVYWFDDKNDQHETDLVVSINDFLFIVESKSGLLTESAKRGATERLFKNLKDLIEEPSYQASKFIKYVNSQENQIVIYDKKKRKQFFPKPKYIIPLGVTLSQFGVNSTILKKLIKLELFEKVEGITSSINLNDLEVVFEVLESVPQKIHYLQRRKEIEDSLEFVGDEIDLLSMYLENGFNFGKIEKSDTHFLNLVLLSKRIDAYITDSYDGLEHEKPTLKLTKWWRDILNFLEERKPQNWLEKSYILLNMPYDDQEKFEDLFKKQSEDMVNGNLEDKNNNFLIYKSSSSYRRFVLIGYNYLDIEKEIRDQMLLNVIESEKVDTKGIIVIGNNLNKNIYPYSLLASNAHPQLFVR